MALHLARCVAAIFFRATAESVRLRRIGTTLDSDEHSDGLWPSVLAEQRQSVGELQGRTGTCWFPFHMFFQKPPARPRCRQVKFLSLQIYPIVTRRSGHAHPQRTMISQIFPSHSRLTQTVIKSRSLQAIRTRSLIPFSVVLKRCDLSQVARTNPSKSPKQSKITSQTFPVKQSRSPL